MFDNHYKHLFLYEFQWGKQKRICVTTKYGFKAKNQTQNEHENNIKFLTCGDCWLIVVVVAATVVLFIGLPY